MIINYVLANNNVEGPWPILKHRRRICLEEVGKKSLEP
jgi:hypothetical protein